MSFAKLLTYAVPVALGTVGFYKFMTRKVFDRREIPQEPPFTSIVMCALNEEGFIEKALESLEDQNVRCCFPNHFECLLIDSNSKDATAAIAEDYDWTVYQAPRGKLTARHIGMEKARGNIIVSVDADTFYPPAWLNLMLRWFKRPDVVGVVAPRLVNPEESVLASYASAFLSLVDVGPFLAGGMRTPGQGVAFYREAYFEVGGFDLTINQLNVHEMVREEEIRFAMKLRRLGRVPVDWQAPCLTSLRRVRFMSGQKYRKFNEERLAGKRF